jgi:ribosomal protein RSM22 (predicted rRNA methylase)
MATSPELPFDVRARLDALAHGLSRNALAVRAATQSAAFRAGGGSGAIASREDALAYAFTRMPATYAAAVAVLDALREAAPAFAPRTLFDAGAGPGTASFAAVQVFASLDAVSLIDANEALRDLALALMPDASDAQLRQVDYRTGDVLARLDDAVPADLVIASYMAGEVPERDVPRLAGVLWAATAGALAVIEPGTPAGYARIMAMRSALIGAGGQVAAPCPHARACPLVPPDWCHFVRRLPRSRDHLRVKGADAPFEDEKFAYVVVTRAAPHRAQARLLAPPHVTKSAATAKLCTAGGIVIDTVTRREGAAYRQRKSWRWGDAVTMPAENSGTATNRPRSSRDK